MSALEYGCGTGLLSFELCYDLGSITLADTSEGMLEVLREKIAAAGARNLHPLALDLTAGPLPPEQYDLLYSLLVVHHIDDTPAILEAFERVVKPAGYLCICDLDREDGTFHEDEFHGHLGFDRDELKGLVQQAGFENISFTTAHEIHKAERTYPLFLLTARKPG